MKNVTVSASNVHFAVLFLINLRFSNYDAEEHWLINKGDQCKASLEIRFILKFIKSMLHKVFALADHFIHWIHLTCDPCFDFFLFFVTLASTILIQIWTCTIMVKSMCCALTFIIVNFLYGKIKFSGHCCILNLYLINPMTIFIWNSFTLIFLCPG